MVILQKYWKAIDTGTPLEEAYTTLSDAICQGTKDWLAVSAKEFTSFVPINFGTERIEAIAENGTLYDIKALDKNGNMLDVVSSGKSGNLIHIKALQKI